MITRHIIRHTAMAVAATSASVQPCHDAWFRLDRLQFSCVSSAVAAARQFGVRINDQAGALIASLGVSPNQTASTSMVFVLQSSARQQLNYGATTVVQCNPLSAEFWLPPGSIIQIITNALDPGDVLSDLIITISIDRP